jgi:hypothetical protein
MNTAMLHEYLNRAKISGLKAVVFASTGTNSPAVKKTLARLRKQHSINAIAVDRDDLARVNQPEDLVALLKEKVREALYHEEINV